MLTEGVVWLPAGHDAIQGKQGVREWLENPFAAFDYDYTVSEIRVRLVGDRATEQAKFATRVQAKWKPGYRVAKHGRAKQP